MGRFLLQRLFTSLISVIGATVIIFSLIQLHSDPRQLFVPDGGYGITEAQWERLGEKLGFNDPVPVQYVKWIGRTIRGDLGVSLAQQRPVSQVLSRKIGATLQLALGGWAFAIIVGIPLGVLAAVKRATFWDYLGRMFAVFGQGAPPFLVGIVLILVFAVWLRNTPFTLPAGTRPQDFDFRYYILPSITLGWPAAAGLMRLTRSSMLEVLDSEFVKMARGKGVSYQTVIWKHAFRNALIPPLTSALIIFSNWLHGALVVESVFAWPGIGFVALFTAVNDNDFPLLLGSVFIYVLMFLVFALLADIMYALVDPRIRLGRRSR
ncbi:MAG: ABC transporter permease [Dehalococcoidia bacterium]|nr:ABC transporter permease [Dehalococcoidia bacterium]MSQ34709.1 ABC transporter permease [Dehalococcoidia bacterium]